MAFVQLPKRVALKDLNSAADINQLQENCDYLRSIVDAPYSAYYVQSTPPSGPAYGTLWYDTTTNKLYKYSDTDWIEIDWQQIIKATPEWKAGKLRVSSGVLQITPNSGTNWYDCYPLVSSQNFVIKDYTRKYYQEIGTTVIIYNSDQAPVVFARELINHYRIYSATGQPSLLILSNILCPGGNLYNHYNISGLGHNAYSASVDRIIIKDKPTSSGVCDLMINNIHARTTSIEHFSEDNSAWGVLHISTAIATPSTAYYLGTLGPIGSILIEKKGVI